MKINHKTVTKFVLALSQLCCINASKAFEDNYDNLYHEVDKYCSDPPSYDETEYGKIEEWDVSRISNMRELFARKKHCNPDISAWDVSQVTDFGNMFSGTTFNQNIGRWNVSSCKWFDSMFFDTTSFNQDIGRWDLSSGTHFVSSDTCCNVNGWFTRCFIFLVLVSLLLLLVTVLRVMNAMNS